MHLSKLFFRHFLILPLLSWVISCKPVTHTQELKIETSPVAKVKTSDGPYRPSRERVMDLVHTRLDLSFDWDKKYVIGTANLILTPYFYSLDTFSLDAKGFELLSLGIKRGEDTEPLKYTYDGEKILLNLDKVYSKGDTLEIEIEYIAKPDELPVGGSAAIQQDKGLYFINPDGSDTLKPKQIWTQGETEASSKWFPTIDSPNEKTTQEMFITVDSMYTVLSNGEFIYSIDNGDGTKTEYWKMDLPHAPYLFMMAIGEFEIIKHKWNDIEVNYYVEPEFAPFANTVFGNTPEMLTFFSEKLGYPYPWNKYSQVVVRDFVSGAMENTTATIFMEGLQIDDREALDVNWDYIIAHELFHHWFGDLVTCESWSNLPLNESFANYSEYLWFEYKYGIDEADYHGENELSEYLAEAQTKKEPLIRFHYLDREDMFDRHSYNKGGRVLHYLRSIVGDQAFFSSLNYYLNQHKFKPVEIHDLRLAFEETTGKDLNWFFNQYFLAPGHPELLVNHNFLEGRLTVKVNQTQDTSISPVYTIPLDLSYWVNGKRYNNKVIIDSLEKTFSFHVSQNPELVLLDPDFVLSGTIDHERSLDELQFQFSNGERYLTRSNALNKTIETLIKNGETNLLEHPVSKNMINASLKDDFWVIRKNSLEMLQNLPDSALTYFIEDIKDLAVNDDKSDVRSVAIRVLAGSEPTPSDKYKDIYVQGLNAKPYSVVGASLGALLKGDFEEAVPDLDEYESITNLNIALNLANYYVNSSNISKADWFISKMLAFKSKPRELYNFLFFFGEFSLLLENQTTINEFKKIMLDVEKGSRYEVIKQLARKYLDKLKIEGK